MAAFYPLAAHRGPSTQFSWCRFECGGVRDERCRVSSSAPRGAPPPYSWPWWATPSWDGRSAAMPATANHGDDSTMSAELDGVIGRRNACGGSDGWCLFSVWSLALCFLDFLLHLLLGSCIAVPVAVCPVDACLPSIILNLWCDWPVLCMRNL